MNNQMKLEFSELEKEINKVVKKKKKPAKNKLSQEEYDLLEFKRILNQTPPPKLLKENKDYHNKFLPLQVVEQMLSALFTAYQITIPFAPTEMQGQIMTVVDVKVLHPVLNIWLTYSGLSSVPLIAAENQNMKWNHRNIPATKGFAIINATKEIGQIFRAEKDDHADVMRDYFEKKQDATEETPEQKADKEMKKRLITLIGKSKTLASLRKKQDSVAKLSNTEVTDAYNIKLDELTKKKK